MERIVIELIGDVPYGIWPVIGETPAPRVVIPRSGDRVQPQVENPDIDSWESEGGHIGLGAAE